MVLKVNEMYCKLILSNSCMLIGTSCDSGIVAYMSCWYFIPPLPLSLFPLNMIHAYTHILTLHTGGHRESQVHSTSGEWETITSLRSSLAGVGHPPGVVYISLCKGQASKLFNSWNSNPHGWKSFCRESRRKCWYASDSFIFSLILPVKEKEYIWRFMYFTRIFLHFKSVTVINLTLE